MTSESRKETIDWASLSPEAQKQTALRLIAEKEDCQRLIENLQHAVLIVQDDHLTFFTQRVAAITGHSFPDLLGMRFVDLFSPVDRKQVSLRYTSRLANQDLGTPPVVRIRAKNGKIVWVELFDAHTQWYGKPAVLFHFTDCTARVMAEDQLREDEARYRTIFEHADDAIVFQTENEEIVDANVKACSLFGYSRDELLRMYTHQLLHTDVKSHSIYATMALAQKGPVEVEGRHRDNQRISLEYTISPLISGRKTIFMLIFRDVTERKLAQMRILEAQRKTEAALAQLQKTNQELEASNLRASQMAEEAAKANRYKSQFLATMSHEIRTPMNGVIGMAELLVDTTLTAEQRDFVQSIHSSADALLTIINDILDYSKIEAGKLTIEVIDFDLVQVIKDATNLLAHQIRQKGVQFIVDVDSRIPPMVKGDPVRLRQLLTNLIGNAMKFTRQGKIEVKVSLREDQGGTVLLFFSIQDTGIGIPWELQTKLFQTFTQAELSTTREYGGTGLGLAICKHLVEMMKGEIGVESEAGKGSTFWFTANLEKQALAGLEEQEAQADPPEVSNLQGLIEAETLMVDERLAGLRVLVAEDHPLKQKVLISLLSPLVAAVDAADNGKDALALLARQDYAVILMDDVMPEMDGIQATKALRENGFTQIPIIGMTDQEEEFIQDVLDASGWRQCLTKPIQRQPLIGALSQSIADEDQEIEIEFSMEAEDPDLTQSLPSPIDMQEIMEILNDEDMVQSCFKDFLSIFPDMIAQIRNAIEAQDAKRVGELGHKFKGTLNYLAATQAATLSWELEQMGKKGALSGAEEQLAFLEAECERMETFIRSYTA